ncbi:hypothetical protein GCM10023189_06340 [Nibrella saemangeumensis]|uniref:DUF4369 domain-containing protein n=1 Tax=Nibrella saemangeumensis TaxID=1084526 RepID=A0ABP8MG82_9BACT
MLTAGFALLTSAVSAQHTYQLRSTIQGLNQAKIFLRKQDNNNARVLTVDTTRAQNGTFSFRRAIPEIDFYTVSVEGVPGQTSFIWDHDVVLTGDTKDLRTAEVAGSPLTDEWKKFQTEVDLPYRDQLMTLYNARQQSPANTAVAERVANEEKRLKQEQMQKVQQYIRTNRTSLLSLFLLNSHWTAFSKADAKALYDQLDPTFRTHSVAKRLERQLW